MNNIKCWQDLREIETLSITVRIVTHSTHVGKHFGNSSNVIQLPYDEAISLAHPYPRKIKMCPKLGCKCL